MMVDILAGVLVLLLLAGSVAVWIAIARQSKQEESILPTAPRAEVNWPSLPVALTFAWIAFQLFSLLFFRKPVAEREPTVEMVVGSIVLYALLLPLLLGGLRYRGDAWSRFGITFENAGPDAVVGVKGFLASLIPVYAVMAATLFLRTPDSEHEFLQLLRGDDVWYVVVLVALAAVVLAPLVEELMFRVIVQGWLETRLRPATAIAVSSVIFAAVHGWPDMLPLLPLAVGLGYVFHRTRSYVAVVVMHALFNLLNLLMVLLTQVGEGTP